LRLERDDDVALTPEEAQLRNPTTSVGHDADMEFDDVRKAYIMKATKA
jgi:hypothetical protein